MTYLYILTNYGSAIIGRRQIRELEVDFYSVSSISSTSSFLTQIFIQFQNIFKPVVGAGPHFKCSLKLRYEAKPVFLKPRRVP